MGSKTKRIFILGLVLALATPALAGCLGGDEGDTGDDGDTPTPPTQDDGGDEQPEEMTLVMGTMMPLTGALNNLGPGMQNGAKLAIDDINNANKGLTIEAHHQDDTTTDTARANAALDALIAEGVTAVAGPCCSGITGAVLDKAIENEVIISSPSATSPALTERENDGFFWRVAPTDAGQGRVLASLVSDEGMTSANVIAVNNDYGNGLANIFEEAYEAAGGSVGTISKYDEGATEFSSQVTEACTGAGTSVDAVVLVAYTDDAGAIIKGMQAQDCLGKVRLFASEGVYNPGDPSGTVVGIAGKDGDGNWLAEGMMGTTPETPPERWNTKYMAAYDEEPVQYSAESYDAVMYVALAALMAGSTDGADIKEQLLAVADGGEKCDTFESCADLIAQGEDIDYVGFAHDLEYTELHEPRAGAYGIWKVTADGKMTLQERNVVPS